MAPAGPCQPAAEHGGWKRGMLRGIQQGQRQMQCSPVSSALAAPPCPTSCPPAQPVEPAFLLQRCFPCYRGSIVCTNEGTLLCCCAWLDVLLPGGRGAGGGAARGRGGRSNQQGRGPPPGYMRGPGGMGGPFGFGEPPPGYGYGYGGSERAERWGCASHCNVLVTSPCIWCMWWCASWFAVWVVQAAAALARLTCPQWV